MPGQRCRSECAASAHSKRDSRACAEALRRTDMRREVSRQNPPQGALRSAKQTAEAMALRMVPSLPRGARIPLPRLGGRVCWNL